MPPTTELKRAKHLSLKGLLWRFALCYALLLMLGGAMIHFVSAQGSFAVHLSAFLAAAFYVCMLFGERNQRYFSRREKYLVFASFWLLDRVFHALLIGYLFAERLVANPSLASALLNAFLAIGALHGIALWVFIGLAKTLLLKKNIISTLK